MSVIETAKTTNVFVKDPVEFAFHKKIGNRLRTARLLKGLTQHEISTALGISYQQWQKFEAGENRISICKLVKVCQFLGIGFGFFVKVKKVGKDNVENEFFELTAEGGSADLLRNFAHLPIRDRNLVQQLCQTLAEKYRSES